VVVLMLDQVTGDVFDLSGDGHLLWFSSGVAAARSALAE
jgi:hypothetical protein